MSGAGERQGDPYEITPEALESAAQFVRLVGEAATQTGVSYQPSWGGIEVGHMMVGNLRWTAEGFVLDVRHD